MDAGTLRVLTRWRGSWQDIDAAVAAMRKPVPGKVILDFDER